MKNKLKVLRAIKEVKQEDVAKNLGISLSTYCKKENGKTSFTLSEANKVAIFFESTIDSIFFDDTVNF